MGRNSGCLLAYKHMKPLNNLRILQHNCRATLNVIPAFTWYASPSGALTFVNKRLRVRLTRDAVALAAMLFPQAKRSFVVLKIQVCKEQSVIRHLPERILVVGAQPLLGRAALEGFAEHRQRRVILAFQNGSKHRMRVVHGLEFTSTLPSQTPGQLRSRIAIAGSTLAGHFHR